MRGIVFVILTLLVAGLLAVGLEWLVGLLPSSLNGPLLRVFPIGVHPLALHINVCGIASLVAGYWVMAKFVRK